MLVTAVGILAVVALDAVRATPAAPAGAVQEVGARRTDSALTSPEVAADRRVTFRLRAPEAKAVKVSGDFGADVDMQRSADGVWTVTVGPLDPEMYVYFFTVDGVRLTDPGNPQVKIGYVTTTTTSLLTVPGDRPAFYDVQDVPHGEIRTLLYKSRSNGVTRELTVYVPPGYDKAREPALSGALPAARIRQRSAFVAPLRTRERHPRQPARAAGDRAVPRGHAAGLRRRARQWRWDRHPPEGADGARGDPALYERDLLEDVIPMIDSTYRTIADRSHRAIIGFSMGGGQAGRFGLGHLDTFSQVGIMSAGLGGGGSTAAPAADPIAALASDPAKANTLIDLLWIACGRDDAAMKGAKALHEALDKAGIEHTFVETEGAHHWRVWRRYLRDRCATAVQRFDAATLSRQLVERRDGAPHVQPDASRHLRQFGHVVSEEDQDGVVGRVRLPPAAIRARPSDRPDAAAASHRIRLVGFRHHGDAHAVAVAGGKQRHAEHPRGAALLGRELVRGHQGARLGT